MKNNYVGHLAVANPTNHRDALERSVFLITNHTADIAIGLCINKIQDNIDLSTVAQNMGIPYYRLDPVYEGGDQNINKIHVIHSLDWMGTGTVALNDEIGITNDISILLALAEDGGPEYFKAIAGFGQWVHGNFDKQVKDTKYKGPHKWEIIPATTNNTFLVDDTILWEHCIETSIRRKVSEFFNPFQD